MADENTEALNIKYGLEHDSAAARKDGEKAGEEIAEGVGKGLSKRAKALQDFTLDLAKMKNTGGKFWFQNIEMPKSMDKLKAFADALKLTDRQQSLLANKPRKNSKQYAQLADTIRAAELQEKMAKRVQDAIDRKEKQSGEKSVSRSKQNARKKASVETYARKKEIDAEDRARKRAEREELVREKEHNKALERIDAQKTKQDLKDFYNQGRNEMAVQEYKDLVAQYKQLERLGNGKGGYEKVQAQYANFERVYRRGKDFAPRESLARAMSRVQSLESVLPTSVVDKLVNGVARIGSKINVLRQGKEEIKLMGLETSQTAINTEKLNRQLSRLGAKAKSGLKSLGSAALRPIANGFSRITDRVKRFASQFSRAFRYKVIRQLISNILRLMKEGFQNLDKYSEKYGTPFHTNVIELRTSLTYLKNAFAAMAAPLINYVTPALTKFMDTLASAANHVGAFFAAVTGQEQFSAALRRTVKDAEKTRTKLRDILGFDEINRLSGDTGEDDEAYRMFEEWDPKSGSFFAKVKEILGDDKDWNRLGRELAANLNGLINNIDAGELGRKIGEKINNALTFAVAFLTGIDYSNIGRKLAQFISNVIGSINWENVGAGFVRLMTALPSFLIGLIEDLDYKKIGKALGKFIGSAFKKLADWINENDWEETATKITNGIIDMIKGLDVPTVAKALGDFLVAVLKAGWKILVGFFKALWNEFVATTVSRFENLLPPATRDWIIDKLSFDIDVDVEIDDKSVEDAERKAQGVKRNLDNTFTPIPQKIQMDGGSYTKASEEATSWRSTLGGKFTSILQLVTLAMPAQSVLKDGTQALQKGLDSLGSLSISTKVKMSSIPSALASGWESAQKSLNTNPLEIPTVIQGYGTKSLTAKLSSAQKASASSLRAMKFASGGTVSKGQLFIANEAGPELVGNIGGKTTVTNQDQFTQGLRDANMDVVAAVLQVVNAVNGKNFDVYMDAQKVGRSVTNYQNNMTRRNGRAVTI